MRVTTEIREREERAARLVQARKAAGFSGPKAVADRFGWNINRFKAHEQGRNGFGLSDAKQYAKAFDVSLQWLNFGIGSPDDDLSDSDDLVQQIPLVSWVSAGELTDQASIADLSDFPTLSVADLTPGNWIALRVDGPSMNKISPPDSIIIANLDDTRLIPNACYIIADESGAATYKRYRPNEIPPFQPASYKRMQAPHLEGMIRVIARVKRSYIDM